MPVRNLDQLIVTGLVAWLQQNTVVTEQIPANMMFDYYRLDIPVASNMMLAAHPLEYDESVPLYHYGWLRLNFVFSTQWARTDKTVQALNIESIITSQIKQSGSGSFIEFMQTYIGGNSLQMLGLQNKGDYRELYSPNLNTTSSIKIEFKYRINWQLYQEWLQSFGCDIQSPNQPIYTIADKIYYEQQIPTVATEGT